jgi:hypothetical protein
MSTYPTSKHPRPIGLAAADYAAAARQTPGTTASDDVGVVDDMRGSLVDSDDNTISHFLIYLRVNKHITRRKNTRV